MNNWTNVQIDSLDNWDNQPYSCETLIRITAGGAYGSSSETIRCGAPVTAVVVRTSTLTGREYHSAQCADCTAKWATIAAPVQAAMDFAA